MDNTSDPFQSASRDGEDVAASLSAYSSGSDGGSGDVENNGSRKRRRPMNVTCEACKSRKVKCDRTQPACGWCTRNDVLCEYKQRKKPGLRAGYGRELEGRLDNLEQIIHEQGRQLRALQDATPGLSDLGSPALNHTTIAEQHVAQSDDLHRVASLQHSSPSVVPDPRRSIDGSQQFMYPAVPGRGSGSGPSRPMLQESVGSATQYTPSVGLLASPSSQVTYQTRHQPFAEHTQQLPPYDLLYTLVDLHFKHVNTWLPLLNRKTTMDALFGPAPLEEADRILLHAMVATSLRFCNDPRLTPESKQGYHDSSKQKVQLYGLENSSVRALQALAILALDVTGDINGPPGWNLLALISRSMVQLGLAAESMSSLTAPMYSSIATLRASVLSEPKSFIEDEERRRLFWMVYLLDRYTTVATAFEFSLDDKEIDRCLPCRDDLFAANKPVETRWFRTMESPRFAPTPVDTIGSFAHHCELLGILSRIHRFLKRPIDIESQADVGQWQGSYRALDSELNAWHFSLPDDFINVSRSINTNSGNKSSNCGWIMLHAAHSLVVIRLNSSAAYPAAKSAIFAPSYSAMQKCLAAVDNIRQLCNYVVHNAMLDKVGPPFGFTLWVAARVVLVHGSTMDHEVDPDIDLFVSTLSSMGQYWSTAQRYGEILKRVLDEYRQSQNMGNANGERVTPSSVRILADMRRCAYDLDVLISHQPRSSLKSYHPTRANTPMPNELEYLDVFDLFNFPRMPTAAELGDNETDQAIAPTGSAEIDPMHVAMNIPNFAVPNPDADWLFTGA